MKAVRRQVVAAGLAKEGDVVGCSDLQIDEIERDQQLALPPVYRSFLREMGRGAGRFFRGSDLFYPAVVGLRRAAAGLLAEAGNPFTLPPDAVVFIMHQGYQFGFLASGASDPPVVWYQEGWSAPREQGLTLAAFLIASINTPPPPILA